MKYMGFRGIWPGGPFLLVLLGTLLFLLSRESGSASREARGFEREGWVLLTDPESGSSFHSFQAEGRLGPLVEKNLPRLSGLLDELCRQLPLETGTEIVLAREPETGQRGCTVSLLPERCRYLLGMPVNVNRAGAEDLEMLQGIGPALAGRIVEARESAGGFSSAEDLRRVPGIGEKLLERVGNGVSFK
jgi:competence ComEA-like helix-hairpin-helix protein